MEKPVLAKGEPVLPVDYVRASINLVVTSILIDSISHFRRAHGHRRRVPHGHFSFTVSVLIALAVFSGGEVTAVAMMALTMFVLARSNFFNKKPEDNSFDIVMKDKADKDAIRQYFPAARRVLPHGPAARGRQD